MGRGAARAIADDGMGGGHTRRHGIFRPSNAGKGQHLWASSQIPAPAPPSAHPQGASQCREGGGCPSCGPEGVPGGLGGAAHMRGQPGTRRGYTPSAPAGLHARGQPSQPPRRPPRPPIAGPAVKLAGSIPNVGGGRAPFGGVLGKLRGSGSARSPNTARSKGACWRGGGHRSSLTALSCCWSPPASSAQAQTATICPFSLPASPPPPILFQRGCQVRAARLGGGMMLRFN